MANSNLQVYITEVSIQKSNVKPFNPQDGCPLTTGAPYSKIYADVKFSIYNSGQDDFDPASTTVGYIGEADCKKPALFKFLSFEGLIPGVSYSKYATCVVDDELAGADACTTATSGMKIRAGKFFGGNKVISVKFAITDSDMTTLLGIAAATTLDLKLSVNPLISNGDAGEVFVSRGSELSTYNWLDPTVFPPPVVLYSGPKVVINNLISAEKYLNLAEVQLFFNNVQLLSSSLNFTLSSTYGATYSAQNCNDGDLTDICISGESDPNPTLTIKATAIFNKVVVYNRVDGGQQRIEGATITTTVNGHSSSALFPLSPDAIFTFIVLSTGLQLASAPSNAPTIAPTADSTVFKVIITDLVVPSGNRYINLAEVQLFKDNVLVDPTSLNFVFSSTYPGSPVGNCNDGSFTDFCASNGGTVDANPTLTITSATTFDSVKVYNRPDAGTDRINGATITAIVAGVSSSTTFPTPAAAQYTFSLSTGSLQYSPCK